MGKFDEAIAEAKRAFDIGKRFGDADLQALALVIARQEPRLPGRAGLPGLACSTRRRPLR